MARKRSRSRERVSGIGGVFLRGRKPAKLAAWYRDRLGLSVKDQVAVFKWISPRPDHRVGHTVWAVLGTSDRGWGPGRSTAQVNYRVADLGRLLSQLRSEGVRVSDGVEVSRYGRFAWAEDPEGNRFELWEPPRRYRSPDRHVPME